MPSNNDVTFGLGTEIKLGSQADFLRVKETLTRIGSAHIRNGRPVLFQLVHILHKKGRYFLMHFKEMYALDKMMFGISSIENKVTDETIRCRNVILSLLVNWKMIEAIDGTRVVDFSDGMGNIRVIPFADKSKWLLETKYTFGKDKFVELAAKRYEQKDTTKTQTVAGDRTLS